MLSNFSQICLPPNLVSPIKFHNYWWEASLQNLRQKRFLTNTVKQRGSARTLLECIDLFWASILWWPGKWHLLCNFTQKIDDGLEKFHINLTNSSNMLRLCRWVAGWRTTLLIEMPSPRDQLPAENDSRFKFQFYWNKRCKPNPSVPLKLKAIRVVGKVTRNHIYPTNLAEAEIKSLMRLLSHKVKLPSEWAAEIKRNKEPINKHMEGRVEIEKLVLWWCCETMA